MNQKQTVLALKVVLWLSALAPAVWLLWSLNRGDLGPNPTEALTHTTGMTTLVLLLVTLAVSPLRRLSGWNVLIRLRRPLGLFAFFYATTHFLIWFAFYNVVNVQYMIDDIAERPYITVGFTAWIVLIPLAITSTKGWIRRLGKRWAKLHKSIYIAAALGVVHFYWLVKADTRLPILLGVCLVILLVARAPQFAKVGANRGKRAARPDEVAAKSP